jgi:hypothetical protein
MNDKEGQFPRPLFSYIMRFGVRDNLEPFHEEPYRY